MSDQRIALVTGGNRGIGLGIVEGLAKENYLVIMGSRNIDSGNLAVDFLEDLGGNIDMMQLDISDNRNIVRAAKYVSKTYGKLDVLINNAGITGKSEASLKECDIQEIESVMKVNYYGPLKMNKAFMPLLRKGNDARIINISSGMGALDDLFGEYSAYRLSKAGLNSQTILLSNDLQGEGIKVAAMCPGWVRTDMGGIDATRSIDQGADTAIWLSSATEMESGKFYRDRKVIPW